MMHPDWYNHIELICDCGDTATLIGKLPDNDFACTFYCIGCDTDYEVHKVNIYPETTTGNGHVEAK